MPMIVYRCEDTLESVFTAIYQAYEEKRNHDDTFLSLTDDPLLFAEDIPVTADEEKTRKVMGTLERRFGREDCERLAMALASEDEGKAQAIYRTVVQGLRGKSLRQSGGRLGAQGLRAGPGRIHGSGPPIAVLKIPGAGKRHAVFQNRAEERRSRLPDAPFRRQAAHRELRHL